MTRFFFPFIKSMFHILMQRGLITYRKVIMTLVSGYRSPKSKIDKKNLSCGGGQVVLIRKAIKQNVDIVCCRSTNCKQITASIFCCFSKYCFIVNWVKFENKNFTQL